MEFTFLQKTLIGEIFSYATSHSKLAHKFLSSRPRQKKITHSPREHSYGNLFPATAENGGGNYDLLFKFSQKI